MNVNPPLMKLWMILIITIVMMILGDNNDNAAEISVKMMINMC